MSLPIPVRIRIYLYSSHKFLLGAQHDTFKEPRKGFLFAYVYLRVEILMYTQRENALHVASITAEGFSLFKLEDTVFLYGYVR